MKLDIKDYLYNLNPDYTNKPINKEELYLWANNLIEKLEIQKNKHNKYEDQFIGGITVLEWLIDEFKLK